MKPPDRACVEKGSRFYRANCETIGISIDGAVQYANVVEYCVSSGWARVYRRDVDGNKIRNVLGSGMAVKMVHGVIKVWFK